MAPDGVATAALTRRDWRLLGALICLVVALARPQWNPRSVAVEGRGRDLVIALDISRSMLAADVFPSRLEAARIAILEALPALTGQRIALITFAGSASVRVPLTLDHEFLRFMLERAEPSSADIGGTAIQAALEKAADMALKDAGGHRDLIIFTDGEDHLSNIDRAAETLARSCARTLIVGLGDPVQGARLPDPVQPMRWMQYKDLEVVSRLNDVVLNGLARAGPHVSYVPVRTKSFDLVALYRRLVAGERDEAVVGERREILYTEGYPLFLGLAVLCWLAGTASWRVRLPVRPALCLLALLAQGCGRVEDNRDEVIFQGRFKQALEGSRSGEEQADAEPGAARAILRDAREQFLLAALLKPGDRETARRITALTRRLRELDARIAEREEKDRTRCEDLGVLVEKLRELQAGQEALARKSQMILRRIGPMSGDENETRRLAAALAVEQQPVQAGTTGIRDGITGQRNELRAVLRKAYGVGNDRVIPTELDGPSAALAEAVSAQNRVTAWLGEKPVRWARINSSMHVAADRIGLAREQLSALMPPKDESPNPESVADTAEQGEIPAGETDADGKPSAKGRDFRMAITAHSLPVPNYSPGDILAEEAANEQERTRRNAERTGGKVEKNW